MTASSFCLRVLALLIVPASAAHARTEMINTTADIGSATASCVACHGALGAGSSAGVPRLARQNPDYVAHALSMFKSRTRASEVMQGVAQNLSESDMRDLAIFFSKQHPPRVQEAHAPAPGLVAAGKQLAEIGAEPKVAACFSCHGAGGTGNGARFPSIAGQPEAFLINRLHEFQTQIKQVSAYLSTLDP
jgi:cytochrome c553